MRPFIFIHLLLLLPTAFGITSVNLKKEPNYLQDNKKSSVNYTTCEVTDDTDSHDDPEYADPEYLNDVCYYTHYENKKVEVDFPGVQSCCPFHGHIARTMNCQGIDKDGKEAVFNWAETCIKPSEGGEYEISGSNLKCKGILVQCLTTLHPPTRKL